MITITILIVFIGSFVGTALFFWFKVVCQKDKEAHQEQLRIYAEKFQLHKKQIQKRTTYLHQYDLLRYNLSEALLVQNQIKL